MKNVRVVRPNRTDVEPLDIAISSGSIARLGADIDPAEATRVFDGNGLLAFPGVVDAHMHFGIYNPLDTDIVSESRAAATGGVTTAISYMRSGQYYLNKGGPYADFFPEVLARQQG